MLIGPAAGGSPAVARVVGPLRVPRVVQHLSAPHGLHAVQRQLRLAAQAQDLLHVQVCGGGGGGGCRFMVEV